MKNLSLFYYLAANAPKNSGGGTSHTLTRSKGSQVFKQFWRYAACLLLAFVLGIGNVWGANFTPADIVKSGGTTTDHIKVSTVFSTESGKQFCSEETSLTGVKVNNSASANWNTYYIEIAAETGYELSTLSLKVASNATSDATEAVAFWNGAASGTCSDKGTFTAPAYNNASCANTTITIPSGTKTVRLYRKICISKNSNDFASSNKNDYGGSTTYYVFGITATAASSGGGESTYDITYHCNGGATCPSDLTEQTALPATLATLTKSNYTWGGWYTDAAFSSAASASAPLTANADLYAKFTQSITLDREGATTGSTSVTATYNSATLGSITNPSKDGYSFAGWYDGDDGTGNLVINTSGVLQANVSGYTGAGGIWTSSSERTLHAKWILLTALESGTLYTPGDMLPTGVTISSSSTYEEGLSANSKFFIVGAKASTSGDAGVPEIKTGSKVTYDSQDFTEFCYFKGSAQKSGNIPTSRAIMFKIPSEGTLVVYGNNTIKLYKSGTNATSDVSFSSGKASISVTEDTYYLYAANTSRNIVGVKFTATPSGYTVTYNASSGSGDVPTDGTSYSSGATVTVKGNIGSTPLSRSIFEAPATFLGWSTNENMYGGTHYKAGDEFEITANTTLYAIWGFNITYKDEDKSTEITGLEPTYYIYGEGATLPTNPTAPTGYEFGGWYNAWCVDESSTSSSPCGENAPCGFNDTHCKTTAIGTNDIWDAEYYAKWNPVEATITLDKDGGEGGSASVTATYDAAMPSAGAAPTKSGCSFQGYWTGQAGTGTQYYNATPASVKNSDFTSNNTLYAAWKLNAPVVSCENNVITMTEPAGATVYYTTDGETTPTSGSTVYNSSSKPVIAANTTFKAIAILANHMSSDVVTYHASYVAPSCTDVDAPTDLAEKTSARTTSAITFEWTAAANASSYDVKLWDNSSCTGDPIASGNVTTTSKEFTGLSEGTTYYCKVQSKGNGTTYCTVGGTTDAVSGTTATIPSHTVTAVVNNASYGSAEAVATFIKEGATTNVSATPNSGYRFVSWALSGDGAASAELSSTTTNPTTLTMGTNNVTVTATFELIPTYTVTLNPNNGTIESYDGWTLSAGKYTKTVAEGTELALLEFTRSGYEFMTWRAGGVDKTSPITVSADIELKAIWGTEEEVEIYYWEGGSEGATQRGGTATHYNGDSPVEGNTRVNYSNTVSSTTYYTISLNGKSDWSTDYIKISLDEVIKTGDKVKLTAYYNNSNNKTIDAKMKTAAGTEVFAGSGCAKNSPTEYEYTVPTIVDADELLMTRTTTETNCFITKLVIAGTRVVEELDPAEQPTISAHPAGASYTWKDAVSALTVTAAVTDGGTLHYQWYKAGETDTEVGSDAASYTPAESGTYYVVVTNKMTGYADKSVTSNSATITIDTRPSYTVTYYDGASSLGTESVQEDASPTNYAAKQAKAVYGISGLYEFVGWYNNSDLASEHAIANIAALSITGNTNIYGKWTRIEASSVDLAAYASADGHLAGNESTDAELNTFKTWFTGQGYVYANLYKLDKTTNNNGAYSGLKTRSTDAYVAFNVPANKRVTVKLGSMAAAAEMYINGVKNESQALTGGSTSTGNDNYADWKYDVTEASTFKLLMKSSSTCVVKAITIGEIPAASDDATLSDLKVDGTTVDGFAASTLDYYVELPYGTEDAPTVAGTANDANAKSVTPTQAVSLPGNATIVVVAEDNTTSKTYTVHFSVAPKLGVELIKATHTGEHTANKAGYWSNDVTIDKTTQGGGKLGSDDHYFGLTLGSEKFMNGDLLCIYLKTTEDPSQWLQVFKDKGSNIIVDQQSGIKRGANYFTLSGLPEDGIDELYVYRTTTAKSKMNPYVDYIAVYREMDPFFESFTVAGEDATIDETVSPKTINVIVPAVTDITALTPTYKAWANGGATVSPTTAQNFSAGAIDYTVTSEYSETTTYKVTVTKAAAIDHIDISGTTTVMEGSTTTLSAAVYDTNEELASNQNVTWSVKSGDEGLAEVNASGVVTGKAVGTAHIIATSEADGDISAEVEVTVNAFVGTKRVYWFAYADDAAANDAVNNSTVFGSAPTGSSSGAKTVTLEEGWVMNTTKYAGAPGSTGTFVVPAEYTATFYAAAKASGSSGRYIQLKQGDVVKYTSNEFEGSDPQVVKIEGVAAGTYTIAYVGGMSNFYMYAAELSRYAITSVTLESGFTLRTEDSRTPAMTLVHAKAAVASQTWSIVSSTATGTTINASTGAISAGTTPGTITVQVVVEDAMGNEVTSNTCTVEIVEMFERIDVTGSMTWNWNELSMSNVNVSTERGLALANYIDGEKWKMLNGTNGDYAYRTEASGCYEALNGSSSLSFHTTVPGLVKISGRRRSNDAVVKINGEITVGTVTQSVQTFAAIAVPAGEVTITPDANGMRITKIEFDTNLVPTEAEESTLGGYERTVNPQYYGTICLPKAGVMTGATLFQVAYMDYKEDGVTPYKVYYDEVENGTMQAGMPYIFLAEQSTIGVYYTGTTAVAQEDLLTYHGLHGTLENMVDMSGTGIYMLYNNRVLHSTNPASYLNANRAYIQITEIPGYGNPSYVPSAPTRRRISTGFNGTNTATELDQISNDQSPITHKVLINGQLFILRGEKMYDATGRLVK